MAQNDTCPGVERGLILGSDFLDTVGDQRVRHCNLHGFSAKHILMFYEIK